VATKRDNAFVWTTWLAKVMAGDQSCEWASWFKAHYEDYDKAPSDFDLAKWKINHTRRLRELRVERQKVGERVFSEGENEIRYKAPSGVTVVGKPDLIAVPPNGNPTVYDVKTGQQKASDQVQVLIYMYLLPLGVAAYKGTKPAGCVVYNDTRIQIPSEAVDEKFAADFAYFLDVIGSVEPAAKVPSRNECRYCDIARTECPERIES
jgi:RecB family exonuclease